MQTIKNRLLAARALWSFINLVRHPEHLDRVFEISDSMWHAVTGFATDLAGELGLQAFYAAQIPGGLPLVLLAMGCLNTAIFSMNDRERRFDAIARGWQMGKNARPLFGVRWGDLWERPLAEARAELHVEPYAIDAAAAA
jgi:ubiquinone biosynthesis protein Coq4